MKKKFADKRIKADKIALIERCDEVCSSYARQGYVLTVRQLYYQLVTRNVFPNEERSYKNLVVAVTDGRMLGMIDWDHISDRGRVPSKPSTWSKPQDIMESALRSYREDLWLSQPNYVEVMVEKQALEGIIEPQCADLGVTFTSNKGYSSASAMYAASQRMRAKINQGKLVRLIYLGDHDPSGLDMSRDIEDRLEEFIPGCLEYKLSVHRIALNMDQVEDMDLEPNPAKETDARFKAYKDEYGDESWELDAIEPGVIADLVREEIDAQISDRDAWALAEASEGENKDRIRHAIAQMSL